MAGYIGSGSVFAVLMASFAAALNSSASSRAVRAAAISAVNRDAPAEMSEYHGTPSPSNLSSQAIHPALRRTAINSNQGPLNLDRVFVRCHRPSSCFGIARM